MSSSSRDEGRGKSGAPLFVLSCAAGFLIISACVAYFIVKFFL